MLTQATGLMRVFYVAANVVVAFFLLLHPFFARSLNLLDFFSVRSATILSLILIEICYLELFGGRFKSLIKYSWPWAVHSVIGIWWIIVAVVLFLGAFSIGGGERFIYLAASTLLFSHNIPFLILDICMAGLGGLRKNLYARMCGSG